MRLPAKGGYGGCGVKMRMGCAINYAIEYDAQMAVQRQVEYSTLSFR